MKNREFGVWYNGRWCPLWSSFYFGTTENFSRGGLRDLARTLKCDDNLSVVVWYED